MIFEHSGGPLLSQYHVLQDKLEHHIAFASLDSFNLINKCDR